MGGFYLYSRNTRFDLDTVQRVFDQKKMTVAQRFSCGDWEMVLYEKRVRAFSNCYIAENGYLVIVGALMYKDCAAEQVPAALYRDIQDGCLDTSALNGHFTVIYSDGHDLRMIQDALGTKHVFCLNTFDFFSSSMLACVAASREGVHVDALSIYEKAMIGIVTAPDTYFQEVKSVNAGIAEKVNASCENFMIHVIDHSLQADVQYDHDRDACIERQINTLDGWFAQMKRFSGVRTVDTGLSAGYDSRLVFSLMTRHLGSHIHAHTHDTEGVHAKEKKVAFRLAETEGIACEAVPTQQMDKVSDIEALMIDNIYFFDGRSSFVMGGFNETYTSDYRLKATGASPISLTGIGGEIYRNYYHIIRQNKKLKWYLEKKIVNKAYYNAISNQEIIQEVNERLFEKLRRKLEPSRKDMKGHLFFRRYYGEVMMADGQGVVLDAYNQVSSCFAPFVSENALRSAYRNLRLIGSDGVFEAKMIDKINHRLAGIPSTYGHDMVSIPKAYLFKQYIRGVVSDDMWAKTANLMSGRRPKPGTDNARTAIENSGLYMRSKEYFESIIPDMNLSTLFQGKYEFKNMSVLICTLYLMKDKIKG